MTGVLVVVGGEAAPRGIIARKKFLFLLSARPHPLLIPWTMSSRIPVVRENKSFKNLRDAGSPATGSINLSDLGHPESWYPGQFQNVNCET
jgi:hypothetical protein